MSDVKTTRKWTYDDYCAIPVDGKVHEIIDGVHYMNPAPNTYHQTLSRRIQFQLMEQIELKNRGVVFNAPTDLQLSDQDIIQPDLIVILNREANIVTPTKIRGVPDLVVEIVLKSTQTNDEVRKFNLYHGSGIPEYWIVDPTDQAVRQFIQLRGEYELLGIERATIKPHFIRDVSIDLSRVW